MDNTKEVKTVIYTWNKWSWSTCRNVNSQRTRFENMFTPPECIFRVLFQLSWHSLPAVGDKWSPELLLESAYLIVTPLFFIWKGITGPLSDTILLPFSVFNCCYLCGSWINVRLEQVIHTHITHEGTLSGTLLVNKVINLFCRLVSPWDRVSVHFGSLDDSYPSHTIYFNPHPQFIIVPSWRFLNICKILQSCYISVRTGFATVYH
jgi:hypothetical protein